MITVESTPYNYNPAGNANIWKVTSDNSNILSFRVKILLNGNSTPISVIDMYTTPDLPGGAYINLMSILVNLVKWEISEMDAFIKELASPVSYYTLDITERVYNSSTGIVEDGDNEATQAYYIWAAGVKGDFYPADYLVQDENTADFLTIKPDISVVNDFSTELLYLITKIDFKAIINTYSTDNILINTYASPLQAIGDNRMYKVNISPKGLVNSLQADFTGVNFYTIHLEDGAGNVLSETRKYLYRPLGCNLVPVNLLWINSYGGVDSYQFVNPTKQIQVERTTIAKNPYKINPSGAYSNISGDLFNPDEEIINTNTVTTCTVSSRPLPDNEADWLRELFISRQVLVELSGGKLMPVIITNTSYNIGVNRYLGNAPNIIQVTFRMQDITPDSIMAMRGIGVLMNNTKEVITDNTNNLIIT